MCMTTALIVDDEPLARAHLRYLLEAQEVEIIGEADQATMALQMAEDVQPDLMFVDIQMPGLTGLQLATALQQSSAESLLVFVTGYSEHAVAAFEHAALDYLLKPVSPERLAQTLARARARLSDAQARTEATQRAAMSVAAVTAQEQAPLQRLPIRTDYAVRLIRVEEIAAAVARDKRVYVRTDKEEFRTYYTLSQLEALLPSASFLRIHDSCVVNLNLVEEVIFLGNHTYCVRLSDGQQMPVGRTRYAALQQRLGLDARSPS